MRKPRHLLLLPLLALVWADPSFPQDSAQADDPETATYDSASSEEAVIGQAAASEDTLPAENPEIASDATADEASETDAPAAETIAVESLRETAPEPPPAEESDVQALESIEVTTSYRKENIQDVTGSVQAFSGRALDKAGAVGMEDYLRQVPSVSLQKSGNGKANIAMRGISNINANDTGYGAGSPTVGVYLNDVGIQGSGVFPDLNLFDLQRVEVLKGPQGTLYGEGSMGGAIKMVTNAPNPDRWEARAEVAFAQTEDGAMSRDLRAALNIPIADTLAARITGSSRFSGGFVDYTSLGREDANSVDANSLRAVASWRPTGTLELEYMFLIDDEYRGQFPVVDEGREEDLVNTREEKQYAETRFMINALTGRWTLPFANLTSVSAFYDTQRDSVRRAPVLQSLIETQLRDAPFPAPDLFSNAPLLVTTALDSFSQEFRLVSFGGEEIDWIAGAFYRNRSQRYDQEKREDTVPDDPTGLLTALLGGFNPVQGRQELGFGDETFTQEALYGEVTWNVIPSKFEITGGLRLFQEDVSFFIDTQFYGLEAFLLATDPNNIQLSDRSVRIFFEQSIKTRGLLPKLSAAWNFNEDHMIYATVTRGFRSGTANVYSALQSGPPLIQPDYVWNKEIGTKSTWLDGRLITNLAAYHLDWEDLQGTVLGTAMLGAVPVDFAHLDNAGNAVVVGAEAAVTWAPVDGLVLIGNLGYNEGRITEPAPGSGVIENARLPNSPRLTWNTTFSYNFEFPFALMADLTATYTFIGDQLTIYEVRDGNDVTGGFPVDSYNLIKASFGLRRGGFRAQLFGDNLANKHAITGISAPIPQSTIITPRTVGIRFGYEF